MKQVIIKSVSQKAYDKRRKRFAAGFNVKNKALSDTLKTNIINAAFAVLFYLIIGLSCTAAANIKSLWYETLIKPSYMLPQSIYIIINAAVLLMLIYIFYKAILKRNKAKIINLIINSVICILLSYMFYVLKSPLGSLIIFLVLISQTITIMYGYLKTDRLCSVFLFIYLFWQFFILSVVYAILMLN